MLVLRPRFAALRDRVRLARLVRLRRLHVGVRVKPKRTTMARVRTRARPPTFEPREAFVATLRRSRSTGTTRSSREDAEVGRLRLRARSRRTPRSRSASDRRPRGFARKKPTNRARCRRAGNAAATRVPGPRERGPRGAASAGGLREETRACSDRVDRFASRVLAPTRVALCPSLRSSADFESARDADVTGVGCSEWGNFVAMGSQSHVLVVRRIWKDLSMTTRDWPRRRAWQISETPEASTRAVRPSVLGSEDIFRFEKQSSPIFSSRRGALVHPSVHREDKRTSVGESSACVRGNPKRSASLHPRASSHVA